MPFRPLERLQVNTPGCWLAGAKGPTPNMRDHAEIYIGIWDDGDFTKLSPGSQRLYFLLLSQKRLEYSGVLPLRPSLWASLSSHTSEDDIREALYELADRGFVVVDERTSEVLIRSFFRIDVAKRGKAGHMNDNLIRNALDACHRVDSPVIRDVLVREIYRARPFALTGQEMARRFPDLFEGDGEGASEGGPRGSPEAG
jgi:hypothetical protein